MSTHTRTRLAEKSCLISELRRLAVIAAAAKR